MGIGASKVGFAFASAASLLFGACSSSGTTSKNITPAGGTVSISDGTSVVIPAGALSSNTAISVGTEPNSVTIPQATIVGTVYRFGPEGTQFSTPVTVTLAYDPTKIPNGNTSAGIVIMTAPVGSSSFTALATTIVDSSHVSATTTHFSDFVATVPEGSADLGVTPDLTTIVDFAEQSSDLALDNDDMANTCAFSYNSSTCTLSGCTTMSPAYSLNCAQVNCGCFHTTNTFVAKPAPYTNTTECPGQAVMEMMWISECSFP